MNFDNAIRIYCKDWRQKRIFYYCEEFMDGVWRVARYKRDRPITVKCPSRELLKKALGTYQAHQGRISLSSAVHIEMDKGAN